jgi:hypothetical protein
MSKLAEKIEQLCEAEKKDRLVLALELDEHGRPDCIMINTDGTVMTRLGMIDMAIRHLELLREDIHEELEGRQQHREEKEDTQKPPVGPNEQKLRDKIKTLPEELQGPVNRILEKLKSDIFDKKPSDDKNVDVKKSFMKDFFKEINKRFGFEGNALNPEKK